MMVNYTQTFIQVAPDSRAKAAAVPVPRGGKKTVAVLEYELLINSPYVYTQDEVLFLVHAQHKGIPARELKSNRKQLWREFFSKPRACLRSSPLPKQYGWGIHFDATGKTAIYPVESAEYRQYARDETVTHLPAMRSSRG